MLGSLILRNSFKPTNETYYEKENANANTSEPHEILWKPQITQKSLNQYNQQKPILDIKSSPIFPTEHESYLNSSFNEAQTEIYNKNAFDYSFYLNPINKRPISTLIEPEQHLKKLKAEDEQDISINDSNWDDLDAEDIKDPLMVTEYVNDIFEHLRHSELLSLPNRDLILKNKNIRQNRDILVNWLVKIHNKFGLLPETLFLSINLLDRFLGIEKTALDILQLVGTTCLFIASKYEEIYSPSILHFACETDGVCSVEDIKYMEKVILVKLDYQINYANPLNFLRRISKADNYDVQTRTLAKFLLEITIVDFRFIGSLPSMCATAAMFLARKMLGKTVWDTNLKHYSGNYKESQLMPLCNMMVDYLLKPVVHEDFIKKYQSRKFLRASTLCQEWAKKLETKHFDLLID